MYFQVINFHILIFAGTDFQICQVGTLSKYILVSEQTYFYLGAKTFMAKPQQLKMFQDLKLKLLVKSKPLRQVATPSRTPCEGNVLVLVFFLQQAVKEMKSPKIVVRLP